jgi:thioredoxin 1
MSTAAIITTSVVGVFVLFIIYNYIKIKNMPPAKDHEKIKILTDQNFEKQIKSGITLVDFWAEWCMPCKMMAPVLNDVAADLTDGAEVGKVNIEQFQSVAAKYKVRSIPTLILFKNGKEINRFVGGKSKEFLVTQINQNK